MTTASYRYDVFGVGNALVDIQVQVELATLKELGIDKGIMTLVGPERQAHILAQLGDRERKVSAGGSACNTVVGVAHLGGRAYYAGKVGADDLGTYFQRELAELRIRSDLPPEPGPTGTCLVLNTPDADRTMLTSLASSVRLDEADISPDPIANSKFVYVEGYLWDSPGPRRASRAAMRRARELGRPVAFTYSDPFCVSRAADDFRTISREHADIVFCNEEEACAISGEPDRERAVRTIAGWGPRVFMTAGALGAYHACGGEVDYVPGFPVEAVDTNGAGDLFAGGVLFALSRDHAPRDATRLGNFVASRVVSQVGARLPLGQGDLLELLEQASRG